MKVYLTLTFGGTLERRVQPTMCYRNPIEGYMIFILAQVRRMPNNGLLQTDQKFNESLI